jgi:hypothetical protein
MYFNRYNIVSKLFLKLFLPNGLYIVNLIIAARKSHKTGKGVIEAYWEILLRIIIVLFTLGT